MTSPSRPGTGRWRVVAAARVRRDIERLPEAVAAAVFEFVDSALAEAPHRVGKQLLAPFQGLHAARRGSYRIVYAIDEPAHTVQLVRIDHRADVYRP